MNPIQSILNQIKGYWPIFMLNGMKISLILLMVVGIYLLLITAVPVSHGKSMQELRKYKKGRSAKNQYGNRIIQIFAEKIIPFIKLPSKKKDQLEHNLKKIGKEMTAEQFYSKICVITGIFLILSVFFYILGFLPGVIAFFIGAFAYASQSGREVTKSVEKINAQIRLELPRLFSTFRANAEWSKDIDDFFMKYEKVAGEAFKHDLKRLIVDLRQMNKVKALQLFDERINIKELSPFISGVINVAQGRDAQKYFERMEQEMNTVLEESINRELNSRPGKVFLAVGAIGICIIVMVFYVLLYSSQQMGNFMM